MGDVILDRSVTAAALRVRIAPPRACPTKSDLDHLHIRNDEDGQGDQRGTSASGIRCAPRHDTPDGLTADNHVMPAIIPCRKEGVNVIIPIPPTLPIGETGIMFALFRRDGLATSPA